MSTSDDRTQILLVDDDEALLAALRRDLRARHRIVLTATDGFAALDIVRDQGPGRIAVAVIDLRMPGMDGIELLREMRRVSRSTHVMVLTGYASIATAVEAMRLGAEDYLEKPIDRMHLRQRVEAAERIWTARRPFHSADAGGVVADMVGTSEAMRAVHQSVERLGPSEATVLITGESGTGKEQFARAVHLAGPRHARPLVVIDVAALGGAIIESELFGHVRGAFTGAGMERAGLFRAAGSGTVFLDEIGDLPMPLQAKLLRVIQEREVRPLGTEKVFPMEARIIAATNKDLLAAVRAGEFREDLYHRLNVISVEMPPLRERIEDIPLLADHFLLQFSDERRVEGIADDAMQIMRRYDWPGNVRELQNAILRALVIGTSPKLTVLDLPAQVTSRSEGTGHDDGEGLVPAGPLADIERQAIASALTSTGGNRARAAALLQIGQATLYRKIRKYNLE